MSYFTLLNRLLPLVSYSPGRLCLMHHCDQKQAFLTLSMRLQGLLKVALLHFMHAAFCLTGNASWILLLLKVRHTSNACSVYWPNWLRSVVSVFLILSSWPVTLATSSQLMNRNLSGRELTAPVIASGLKTLSGSGASIFRTQERNPIAFAQAVQLQVSA